MNEEKKEKPKPDAKKYVVMQLVGNAIGALVVALILGGLTFRLFGHGAGSVVEAKWAVLIFVASFALIQCHTALLNTRKDYLKGKWVDEGGGDREPDGIFNPWRRIGPLAIPTGAIAGLAVFLVLPMVASGELKTIVIDLIGFVPLLIITSIAIAVFLPKDQNNLIASLAKDEKQGQAPFTPYMLFEYIIPWVVLQGLINMGIGLKQFIHEMEKTEAMEADGLAPSLIASDFGIVFGIIVFFMFLASEGQVRADLHLGRVEKKSFKCERLGKIGLLVIVPGVLTVTIGIMAVVGLIAWVAFGVIGIETFSVNQAVALKVIAAGLGAVAGCLVGVWWGTRRETALIEEQSLD